MQDEKNKILTIIVTYNGLKWINKCIDSIRLSSLQADIYVVDNGSKDDTVIALKKYTDIFIYENKTNLGFGQANNIGMQYALNNGYDYVFLLNQDTWIEKNTIEILCRIAKKNGDYGILSPMHYFSDEKSLEYFFSSRLAPFYCKNILSDFIVNGVENMNDVYSLNFINAAAWFIPIKILKKIGGFSPLFFHYGEDNNFCHRVLFHNFKIGIVPKTKIYHDCKTPDQLLIQQNGWSEIERKILDFKVGNANINSKESYFSLMIQVLKLVLTGFVYLLRGDFEKGKVYLKTAIGCFKSINRILECRFTTYLINSNYL